MTRPKLNKDHVTLINCAVKKAFTEDSWTYVETFSRGNSPSALYKLKINNKNYVAKLTDPNYPGWSLTAAYSAQINGFHNKVAPRVHYSDPSTGILVMDYIEAAPLEEINHKQPEITEKLSKLLKRLHHCDDFQKGLSMYQRVEFRHNLLPPNFKSHNLIKHAMQAKEMIEHILIDANDIKPCHGDVTPFNLLFDRNSFWLVDWETATQDNFYFDVATCMIFFYFNNKKTSELFLNHYFERPPTQMERDKLDLMKVFVYVYYGITFAYTSSLRKVDLLSQEAIDALPSYLEFMDSIGSGEVNLGDGQAQQQLGFIYLKMAEAACSSEEFLNSVTSLKKYQKSIFRR